jgi:chemotaxis protein histidine kinase CheA
MESRLLTDSDNVDTQSRGGLLGEFAALKNEWAQIRNFALVMRSAGNLSDRENNDSKKIGLGQLQKTKETILQHFDHVLQMQDSGEQSKILYAELNKLRESVRRIGYIKAESIAEKLQFICASTAKKLGKTANLKLEFNAIEFSSDALSKLTEVFLHLITNSLDHAIEFPEARRALGKNEVGTISIRLEQASERTYLCEFVDDGSGIDIDKVKAVAEKRGILQSGDQISRFEAMNLIMRSNFSTANSVTETSGRGIGLAAAVEAVSSLNAVEGLRVVSTEPGKGTVFSFTIKP